MRAFPVKACGVVLAALALGLVSGTPIFAATTVPLRSIVNDLSVIGDLATVGKIATASVSGDHFNCIATNVGDVNSINVGVTLYDDLGNALSSFPIDALAPCSDVGPHKSCGITFIQQSSSGVHCEIQVLGGDQANVRGAVSSYRFEGDTLIETKLDAR